MKVVVWNTICILILLVICTYTDIRSREVSVKVLFGFGVVETVLLLFEFLADGIYLPTGIFVGAAMWIVSRFTKGAVGEGDALLLIVTGILLSLEESLVLLIGASFAAAVCGVFLLIFTKTGRKEELPFVPFLLASYIGMIMI